MRTDLARLQTSRVLHIRSCGYTGGCPQSAFQHSRFRCSWRPGRAHPAGEVAIRQANELDQVDLTRQPNIPAPAEKKFSERIARSVSGLQPKYVYKVSSSVNNWHFLWISQLTDEKSLVYALYKPLACPCIVQLANLDNFSDPGKRPVSAQTVPVDIKNLIHRGPSGVTFTIW